MKSIERESNCDRGEYCNFYRKAEIPVFHERKANKLNKYYKSRKK